jgi:hypothetical protein
MIHNAITPYTPEDALRKMADTLKQMNGKIESSTNRSVKAKIKIGFMSTISIQANVTETPFGSIVEFTVPEVLQEQLVDDVFFGNKVAGVSQTEKMEKIRLKIDELKANIDGLDKEEARRVLGFNTRVKFLANCPNCNSPNRKGFRCANCNHLMVEFE